MNNNPNYYKDINQISWLLQAIKEKQRQIEKECLSLYGYLDIVLSNEFCFVESNWKKLKTVNEAAIMKYRYLLKRGLLNVEVIKRNLSNYAIRLRILSFDAYRALKDLYLLRQKYVPNVYLQVLKSQKDMLKLTDDLANNPIVKIENINK